jgi:type II secretory pathway component PulF
MKRQTIILGCLTFLGVFMLASVIYLIFIFPKTVAVWADQARSLPVLLQMLVEVGDVCKWSAFFLIPLLLLGTLACAVWTGRAAGND